MKNAKTHEKKIRKLLRGVKKGSADGEKVAVEEGIRVLIESVLQADATVEQARQAMEHLEEEFVDYNELRVCQTKEVSEVMGKEFPEARAKAEILSTVLNNLYGEGSTVDLSYMQEMNKREARRHLGELGLDAYSSARVARLVFDIHAVPVDKALAEILEMQDLIEPGSAEDLEDVQAFLERIIAQKDLPETCAFLRTFVEKHLGALQKKHAEQAEAARKQAEQAEKRAKAAEEAKAKKAAEDKAKAEKKKAATKKKAAKKSTKTNAKKKTRKKTAKKKSSAKKAPAAKKAKKKTAKKKSSKSGRTSGAKKTSKTKSGKTAKKKTRKKATKKKSAKKKAKKKTSKKKTSK